MFESCGGNFHEGRSQSNGFHLIKEYFQQRACKHCGRNFTSEGIELLREEQGMLVVRVGCSGCGQPLGIALVGMSGGGTAKSLPEMPRSLPSPASSCHSGVDIPYPADWSKSDIQRLSKTPRITYDDVLDAHEFFSGLGDDWSKHLPRRTGRRTGKPISAG